MTGAPSITATWWQLSEEYRPYYQELKGFWGRWQELVLAGPNGQDGLWRKWAEGKPDEPRLLLDLLKADVDDGFKARALLVLLVPDLHLVAPFAYWGTVNPTYRNYVSLTRVELGELSPTLTRFVGELVRMFVSWLTVEDADRLWDRNASIYDHYERAIQALLPVVGEELGMDLLAWLRIDQLMSGGTYWPFSRLLLDPAVPQPYKVAAETEVRKHLLAEAQGTDNFYQEVGGLLMWYVAQLAIATSMSPLPYSVDLLADQVAFVTSFQPRDFGVWTWDVVFRLILILGDSSHAELRKTLLTYVADGLWPINHLIWQRTTLDQITKESRELGLLRDGSSNLALLLARSEHELGRAEEREMAVAAHSARLLGGMHSNNWRN